MNSRLTLLLALPSTPLHGVQTPLSLSPPLPAGASRSSLVFSRRRCMIAMRWRRDRAFSPHREHKRENGVEPEGTENGQVDVTPENFFWRSSWSSCIVSFLSISLSLRPFVYDKFCATCYGVSSPDEHNLFRNCRHSARRGRLALVRTDGFRCPKSVGSLMQDGGRVFKFWIARGRR